MQDTLAQFLGQEDQLEEGLTTHSSILGFPGAQMAKNLPAMRET